MSQVVAIQNAILDLEQRIDRLEVQLEGALRRNDELRQREITAEIQSINREIAQLRANLQLAQQRESLGSASAGNLVDDDAIATVSFARTQTPEPEAEILVDGRIEPEPDTFTPTNALAAVTAEDVDSGLDVPVRPITATQATPPYDPNLLLNPGDAENQEGGFYGGIAPPALFPGVGAGNDDSGSRNLTRQEIDTIFDENDIKPLPNVLDQYASYTYTISVYLTSEAAYRNMAETKQKNIQGSQLLFQSGGAAVGGRNQYFTNDYYIDKVDLKSKIVGKATGLTHNVTDVKMTVVEPNGITFLDNLDKAIQSVYGSDRKKNLTSVVYLMVIRFYGYDVQGNLVRGGVANPNGGSDPNAFVEKFFPFLIKQVKFKVANKLVEYDIEATGVHYIINAGSARGTIPYNIELAGQTVKDMLAGPGQVVTPTASEQGDNTLTTAVQIAPAPQKANAAPSNKTTIRQGLMNALNEFQLQLVKEKKYTYPDEYSIEFGISSLENARLRKAGGLVKSTTGNPVPKTAADQLLPSKTSMDPNVRTQSATAGMQIVQFLDQIIRNSTYLEDQQLVKFDEKSQKYLSNGTPAQNVAWFKINMEAVPKLDQYDPLRNDYSYKIKYTVVPYRLSQLNSKYFPAPKFIGVQKEYNYWFTGQNTSVLNYEENLNGLYYLTLSGVNFNTNPYVTNAGDDQIKYNFQSRSTESSQGAEGKTNEPVANAAEQLFSPADLKDAAVTIVGDPSWLQQGEAFMGLKRNDPYYYRSFLSDGTINFDSGQILFRIAFNVASDYDTSTGLITPGLASGSATVSVGQEAGPAQINRIYIAKEVTSSFNRGKFTQLLSGSLLVDATASDNAAARQITLSNQLAAIAALAQGRGGSISAALAGSLSTPAFSLPLLQNFNGAALAQQGVNLIAQNILGGGSTRYASPPNAPTSSNLPVGLINGLFQPPRKLSSIGNNPIINNTTQGGNFFDRLFVDPNAPAYTGDDPIVRARLGLPPVDAAPAPQVIAGSDDSGDLYNEGFFSTNDYGQQNTFEEPIQLAGPSDLDDFLG